MNRTTASVWAALALAVAGVASRGDEAKPAPAAKPTPNSPAEPPAESLSLARTASFLDGVAGAWTREKKCGTCHTNYPYLMARPLLKDAPLTGHDEVRGFFEKRVAGWETAKGKPRWDTEVVATAAVLAYNDALTTGKLHPLTRKALDKAWTLQRKDGSWDWIKCTWPPFEHDDYYGATLAAVGVGHAPDGYARGDSARDGVARLRDYFRTVPAPDLHHRTWLLWASLKLDGLMTQAQRDATVKDLLALQRPDGGWSLASLGDWKAYDGRDNDTSAASDGYATGLAVFVLRQTGVPANRDALRRGVDWLKGNQRASGRWFTKSLNTDGAHYIANAGTCFAVMALKACE